MGHVLMLALACGRGEGPATKGAAKVEAAPDPAAEERRRAEEAAHRVVFADRIAFGYVLLLPEPGGAGGGAGGEAKTGAGTQAAGGEVKAGAGTQGASAGEVVAPPPTRAELQAIVRRAFADRLGDPEVELLLDLVGTPPRPDLGELRVPGQSGAKDRLEEPADLKAAERVWATSDLLGLEIDALPAAAVGPELLADPELSRALTAEERASLGGRTRRVLVRALYRNQNAVRGLRLLQALVRAVAAETGALVHDPDTLETMGPAAFAARRLQTSLGNVADQVAVVPFADPARPDAVRLTTRGMRRFGSVDLELDGLERDLARLQQATYFLHGLALVMVRLGEFDRSGFAVEAPEVIGLHYRDCVAAYAGQIALPRCEGACPQEVEVHLVDRPPESHDPPGHVVARVVAPRAVGERPGHDHAGWIRAALDRVLGRPSG